MFGKLLPGKRKKKAGGRDLSDRGIFYPKHGPGQLWETVAAEVEARGGTLLQGCRVSRLELSDGVIRGVCYEKDGETHELEGVLSFPPCR